MEVCDYLKNPTTPEGGWRLKPRAVNTLNKKKKNKKKKKKKKKKKNFFFYCNNNLLILFSFYHFKSTFLD